MAKCTEKSAENTTTHNAQTLINWNYSAHKNRNKCRIMQEMITF